jgi:serine/threonine protein kinase
MGKAFKPVNFGRYLLTSRLAVGGMAEIFAAKVFGAMGFEKSVVIKRILPQFSQDAEFLRMFITEAKLVCHLQHPNIVQVHDLNGIDGQYYIAMEYVNGIDGRQLWRTLAKRKQRLPGVLALLVVAEFLKGLDYAHRAVGPDNQLLGVVHRDVSPSNILISYRGDVKIGDFGIALVQQESKTQAGVLKGKYGYMSPEQVAGLAVDHRSDIFAAGIVLAELLLGRRLFLGRSDFETLDKVMNARLDVLEQHEGALPPEVVRIARLALQREPGDRYQSAREFHDDIMEFLFSRGERVTNETLSAFIAQHVAPFLARTGDADGTDSASGGDQSGPAAVQSPMLPSGIVPRDLGAQESAVQQINTDEGSIDDDGLEFDLGGGGTINIAPPGGGEDELAQVALGAFDPGPFDPGPGAGDPGAGQPAGLPGETVLPSDFGDQQRTNEYAGTSADELFGDPPANPAGPPIPAPAESAVAGRIEGIELPPDDGVLFESGFVQPNYASAVQDPNSSAGAEFDLSADQPASAAGLEDPPTAEGVSIEPEPPLPLWDNVIDADYQFGAIPQLDLNESPSGIGELDLDGFAEEDRYNHQFGGLDGPGTELELDSGLEDNIAYNVGTLAAPPSEREEPQAMISAQLQAAQEQTAGNDQPDFAGQLGMRTMTKVLFRFGLVNENGLLSITGPERGGEHREHLTWLTELVAEVTKRSASSKTAETRTCEIRLDDGQPKLISADRNEESLVAHLLCEQTLERDDVKASLLANPHRSLMAALLNAGQISPLQVSRHVTSYVQENVLATFYWEEGTFAFYRGREVNYEVFPSGMSLTELIRSGVAGIPEDVLDRYFGRIAAGRLVPAENPPAHIDVFDPDEVLLEAYQSIGRRHTVMDLIAACRSGAPVDAKRALYLLLECELADLV